MKPCSIRAFGALVAVSLPAVSQTELMAATKPDPSFADISYGPSPLQLLDIYVPPERGEPRPALLRFGGIWRPSKSAPDPGRFLAQRGAVVAVQTRTLREGMAEKANPPISCVMNDACRAVQFVRLNAAKWNTDPRRLAVGGSSQGALPALYVACAGDRADPNSTDPVERVSTKVLCVGANRCQPSIDPKRMQEWVPGVKWGAPALGCSFDESLKRREELLPLSARWSPDAPLHRGTPPIYFENNWGLARPETVGEMDYLVHSSAWAMGFRKLAQERGVVCYVKYPGHPTEQYKDIWDFLIQQMKAPVRRPERSSQ